MSSTYATTDTDGVERPIDRLEGYRDELLELREMADERGFDAVIRYIDAALEEIDR